MCKKIGGGFGTNPLVIISDYGKVKIANSSFSSLVGISSENVEGIDLFQIEGKILDQQVLKRVITKAKNSKHTSTINTPGLILGKKESSVRTQYLQPEAGNEALIFLEFMTI